MKYMVSNLWLNQNLKQLIPNSIVINNSCSSLKTNSLWESFKKLGAAAYYGYTGAVTNDYVTIQTSLLLNNLIYCDKTTGEAYEYSFDAQYDGDYFGIRGAENIALPYGLMNGGFEENLRGWEKDGDGRVIKKLGSITPTQGKKMGVISTGIGYTQKLGELSQNIYIPNDATKLMFDWNFVSEEFLDYIGTSYNDPFEIKLFLTGEDGKKVSLLKMDVNSIAEDFNAGKKKAGDLIHVSPEIAFDQGDVWMTDWQSQSINISKYAGQNVRLCFSVQDAQDRFYTTAVLIDNILFDVGNVESSAQIELSEEYSESTVRGLFGGKNTTGRSYVFYDKSNFESQAKTARKRIKFERGYKSINQVKMYDIATEDAFVNLWRNMVGDTKTGKIDEVCLLFHSRHYAIMLDAEHYQNITTCPEGKVSSDSTATYIRDLPKKKIKCINIQGCSSGLLDAINLLGNTIVGKNKGEDVLLNVKGNVAQGFLDSQDVDEVHAWDGSVSYFFGYPRISRNQNPFYEKIQYLKTSRRYAPIRGTKIINTVGAGTTVYWEGTNKPYGEIRYYKEKGGMFCKYYYNIRRNIGLFSTRYKKGVKVRLRNFNY